MLTALITRRILPFVILRRTETSHDVPASKIAPIFILRGDEVVMTDADLV